MPRGPKGERRPADVVGDAVHVMRVLTGEIEDAIPTPESEGKERLGRMPHTDKWSQPLTQIIG
jgi:hypothetical protein